MPGYPASSQCLPEIPSQPRGLAQTSPSPSYLLPGASRCPSVPEVRILPVCTEMPLSDCCFLPPFPDINLRSCSICLLPTHPPSFQELLPLPLPPSHPRSHMPAYLLSLLPVPVTLLHTSPASSSSLSPRTLLPNPRGPHLATTPSRDGESVVWRREERTEKTRQEGSTPGPRNQHHLSKTVRTCLPTPPVQKKRQLVTGIGLSMVQKF